MAFRPRMDSTTDGIRLCRDLAWRAGDGLVADLWHVRGEPGGGGRYVSPDPRIVVLLDAGGGALELAEGPGRGFRPAARALFVPAGMPLWSRIARDAPFRHMDLHLDRARIADRLEGRVAEAAWDRPILNGGTPALIARARAVARLCLGGPGALPDRPVLALVAEVMGAAGQGDAVITPRQMGRIRDHVEAHLSAPIAVPDLARIAGLSESWFARSFKRATGLSPHRWLLHQRLARARGLIEGSQLTLAEVAAEAGFADQAHLTRSFRDLTGQTPGAWRRDVRPLRALPQPGAKNPTETIKTGGAPFG